MERHLQYAVLQRDSGLAVGLGCDEVSQLGSAGPHNELADSLSLVRLSARILRGEAFVVVVMTV
jgi:hypothetical protein